MAVVTSSTANTIKIHIMHTLFNKINTKSIDELDSIFSAHLDRDPDSKGGFWYKGRLWCKNAKPFSATNLGEPLHERMNMYMNEFDNVKKESHYVESYLTLLLSNYELGQLYGFLPHELHPILQNRGVDNLNYTPTKEDMEFVTRYNHQGYDLVLVRILSNLVGA